MRVEIFIKSISMTGDFELLIYSREHIACAPELMRQVDKSLMGRVLDGRSAAILERLAILKERLGDNLKVYDVGRFSGWIRARVRGVKEIPSIIVNGEGHDGFQATRLILQDLISES